MKILISLKWRGIGHNKFFVSWRIFLCFSGVWVCGGKTGIGDNNHQKKCLSDARKFEMVITWRALSHCGHDERCGTEMEKQPTKQTRKQQNIKWRKLTTAPGNIKCVESFLYCASVGHRAELDPLRISSTQNRPKQVHHFEYFAAYLNTVLSCSNPVRLLLNRKPIRRNPELFC